MPLPRSDLVALLQVVQCPAVGHDVDALCGVAREDHLLRAHSVDEGGHLAAGPFVALGRLLAAVGRASVQVGDVSGSAACYGPSAGQGGQATHPPQLMLHALVHVSAGAVVVRAHGLCRQAEGLGQTVADGRGVPALAPMPPPLQTGAHTSSTALGFCEVAAVSK